MIPETKPAHPALTSPIYVQENGWSIQRILKADADYSQFVIPAHNSIEKIYTHTLKLRQDDKLIFIADSASDLAAFRVMIETSKNKVKSVDIYYLKDFHNDDLPVDDYFADLTDEKTSLFIIDTLDDQIKAEFYRKLSERQYDVGINMMNGSYDIRTKIGEIAGSYMPVAEMPGIQIKTLTQPVFHTNPEDMKPIGDRLISILKDVKTFHFTDFLGNELSFEVNATDPWINEANNGFALRRKDFKGSENLQFVVDNLPMGEIYKNVRLGTACGRWLFPQIDMDVWQWAQRMGMINEQQKKQMFIDFADQVLITFHNGKIVDVAGGIRPEIFKKYLQEHAKKDETPQAILYLTEIAFGINIGGLIPETGEETTLGGEKALIIHLAWGNAPAQDINLTNPRNIIQSDSHLDQELRGLFNLDVTLYNGKRLTLFGIGGILDGYSTEFLRYQQQILDINTNHHK